MKVLLLIYLTEPFVTSLICITIYLSSPKIFCCPKLELINKLIQSSTLYHHFLFKMETFRNKKKLAAVAKDNQEGSPRNSQLRNSVVPRINEEYITQVSKEIESKVTKKLSQEFSRTRSRILGALPKLYDVLLNPHVRVQSGTVPGTSWT